MLLSSMAGSSSGSNESAIAGHLNSMTEKAYATFVLSLALQLLVPSLRQPGKNQRTFVSFERMTAFVQLFEWRPRTRLSP